MARAWSPASSKSDTRLKRSYTEGMGTYHRTRAARSLLGGWRLGARDWKLGAELRLRRTSQGCEVALAGAGAKILPVFRCQFDLDTTPRAVGLIVGRHVSDRVLRPNFAHHLLVHQIELFGGRRKERLASGGFGNCIEDRSGF